MSETEDFTKWLLKTMVNVNEFKYDKILHVMEEKTELQVPSQKESYKFNRKSWNVEKDEEYFYLTKKN